MSRVVLIVLGDIGRSPRMQYHAYSLSNLETVNEVILLGYDGELCMKAIEDKQKIKQVRFLVPTFPLPVDAQNSSIGVLFKGFNLLFQIFKELLRIDLSSVNLIIIQNPPCLPAVIISIFLSLFYSTKVVIDWHNLGFKMLEEKYGRETLLSNISKWLEFFISHHCYAHICVSNSMKSWLQDKFFLHPIVVYDRPFKIFESSSTELDRKHNLLVKYQFNDQILFPHLVANDSSLPLNHATISTDIIENNVVNRKDGAHILVSSTSWTADEDFDMLLDSMILLNLRLFNIRQKIISSSKESDPKLWPQRIVLFITGKGELKNAFIEKVKKLESENALDYVAIRCLWLESSGK
jgi:beta-1,4-mannosyltransferase